MFKRIGGMMLGYLVATAGIAIGIFWLVVEAQAREDEANEQEMLRNRNWDML